MDTLDVSNTDSIFQRFALDIIKVDFICYKFKLKMDDLPKNKNKTVSYTGL